jgi:hypothetical protein
MIQNDDLISPTAGPIFSWCDAQSVPSLDHAYPAGAKK